MKHFLLLLPLLTVMSPALAVPTYLTCKDTSATESVVKTETNKQDETTTKSELETRKVFLDLASNKSTLMGMEARLELEPNTIKVIKTSFSSNPENSRGSSSSADRIYAMTINRASLTYDYSYRGYTTFAIDNRKLMRTTSSMLNQIGAPILVNVTKRTVGKASGVCKKIQAPVNNQI